MAEVFENGTFPAGKGALLCRITAAAGLLAVLGFGPSARANLRAPVVIPESPSSALAGPALPLIVENEVLTFLCGAQSCLVTAQYLVGATAPSRVRLEFILPADVAVTATTNSEPASAQLVPAVPLKPEELRTVSPLEPRASGLFRAGFESSLREGSNSVTVRYVQPLGAKEVDYGYLKKKGRMVQRFRYELWPLREWTRAPEFRVTLAVAVDRLAPGWWRRRFGNSRSVTCLTSDLSGPVPASRLEQRGGQLWYEAELGPSIPDRITCFIGDEDLLPRH